MTTAHCIMRVVLSYAVYVIFGATGGIGQDLAKRLLAANNKVVLAAHDEDKLSKLKEELGGGETKAIDVMDSKQVCLYFTVHALFSSFCSPNSKSSASCAVILIKVAAWWLQIIEFLEGVAKEHGEVTGVTNLIGNMCIKPAHLTSDEEVWLEQSALQAFACCCGCMSCYASQRTYTCKHTLWCF